VKRISRDPQRFDLIEILDEYARSRGLDIRDPSGDEAFLRHLGSQIEANRRSDILLYGLRAQTMFAFVAAALGACRAIKEEDTGNLYVDNPELRAPDFRIIMLDGREFLAEVKNCHTADPQRDLRFTRAYLDGLKAYAALFQTELFIAIYWSPPKLWTLLSADDFELRDQEYILPLLRAMKLDKMHILGDRLIGTVPSLTLKLVADPNESRAIDATGHVTFKIGQAELYCGDQLIEDDIEKEIAWFLMNYGNWGSRKLPAEIVDGKLVSMGFRVTPEERANPDEDFEIVGRLSEMISRQFNELTAPGGAVKHLSPERDPDTLGVVVPLDYRGTALPLWRFTIHP